MSDHRPVDPAKLRRQKRLEAQLRDNLKRRKAAARPNANAASDDEGPSETSTSKADAKT